MWRSRWAAVGAAVVITLGAGGIGIVDATKSSGERSVYTAIEPCRLLDTRPNFGIGGRTAPLGPGETYPLTAHGDNGECTGIPNDTLALELNVTGLFNTGATHFTIWSGAGDVPNASHVNLAVGASPTPNSVTTELAGAQFAIRNNSATSHVIIDIVGIYQDHNHDDRYYTEGQVDAALGSKANAADVYTKAAADAKTWSSASLTNEPGVVQSYAGPNNSLTGAPETVSSLAIRVPSDGYVLVNVTGKWHGLAAGVTDIANCGVTKGTTLPAGNTIRLNDGNGDAAGSYRGFSGHFLLEVDLADNPLQPQLGQLLNLVCQESSGNVEVAQIEMSGVFFSTSYAPSGLVAAPDVVDGPSTEFENGVEVTR